MNEMPDTLNVPPLMSLPDLPVFSKNAEESLRLREEAMEIFRKKGFPEKNDEEYKYSPTGKVFEAFAPALNGNSPASNEIPVGIQIKFRGNNIEILGKEQLPSGFVICSLEEALAQKHPAALKHLNQLFQQPDDALLALNMAGASAGLFIFAPPKSNLKQVLHIIYPEANQDRGLLHLRNLYVFSDQSETAIAEYWISSGSGQRGISWSSEITLEGTARLHLYKNQVAGSGAVLFDHCHAQLLGKGMLKTVTVSHGGKWIRNNLCIEMNAPEAEVHLNGLFSAADKQHVDHHTAVIHAKPHCNSFQLYKGILQQQSSGVFNGKILVKRDAQKTNAYQSSRNLILGNQASVNAKPQLEIFADDVKCSHGSSTGKIDADALFYLRCRGISEQSARRLLLDAFAGEVLDTIEHEEIKTFASEQVFSGRN
jgi:Fe-S cluster assembly protein SufD